jgi:hypothetical protein
VAVVDRYFVTAMPESVHARRQAMTLGAALFAGGSLLTIVALIAPRSQQVDVAGSWIVVLLSALVAALLWLGRDRLPLWALFVAIGAGTLLITGGLYINGERDGGPAALNEIYYVWPVVFAAYYFPIWALVLEVCFVAACYAGILFVIDPGPIGVTRWLIVVTMLVGAGGLISRLQRRVDELVASRRSLRRRTSSCAWGPRSSPLRATPGSPS